jgi:hypothetical protein
MEKIMSEKMKLTISELDLIKVVISHMNPRSGNNIKDLRLLKSVASKANAIKETVQLPICEVAPADQQKPENKEAMEKYKEEMEKYYKTEVESSFNSAEENIIKIKLAQFDQFTNEDKWMDIILGLADKFKL